jgi:hypothetical protein
MSIEKFVSNAYFLRSIITRLENSMYFLRVLSRNGEPHPIWLPPPIQSETSPSQSPWRQGDRSLNVACLPCKHVSEYSEPNCRWEPVQSTAQLETCRNTAIYLLAVPCGVRQCTYLINILLIAKKGMTPSEGDEIANSLFAMGVVCENGHRTTFQLTDKLPRVLNVYENFWESRE